NAVLRGWQSPVRLLAHRQWLAMSHRKQMKLEYEINLDYSWVPIDENGRRKPLIYLTDASKTPEDVLNNLDNFDKQRMREIGEQIDIQAALGKSRVPDKSKLTSFDWVQLLSCNSTGTLGKKLFYLATKQNSEASALEKKAIKKRSTVKQELAPSYDYIHPRIEKTEIKAFYDMRLIQEYKFCPSLVFDMSFHEEMKLKFLMDFANQLREIFHTNRESVEPFQLHFCNLARDTQQYYVLNRALKSYDYGIGEFSSHESFEDSWPYEFTDACYTSLFPAKDLIYMSPDAKYEMRDYDPTKVYIIGGLVDLGGGCVGATKSKATRQGIRSLRLSRSIASRSLPLNIFYNIIRDIRLTGSWVEARRHVPRRISEQRIIQSPTAQQSLLHGYQPRSGGF
ncbi:hypothetical protein BOX15_Mlig016274g10, partial [Macrostomum lignano]